MLRQPTLPVLTLLLGAALPSIHARGAAPAAAAPASAVAPRPDDEIVKEFKKYFRKYKDSATRVEAILALEAADSAGVVKALVPLLKDKDPRVVEASIRVLSKQRSDGAVEALFLELEEASKEQIRRGLLTVVTKAGHQAFEAVAPALEDKSWEVRRLAVQAVASCQGAAAVEAIAPYVSDPEPAVRAATLDALTKRRDPSVVAPAIAALEDKSWQVRASAAAALGTVRDQSAIEPLVVALETEEGRLVEDYAKALTALTGRLFGPRPEAWRNWWNTVSSRYQLPSDEDMKKLMARRAELQEQYTPSEGTVSYHGIATESRRMLFVIDVSGSMEDFVVQRDRFKDGDYPSFMRLDIVKTELSRTVESLGKDVEFNVLTFATKVRPWKKKPVRANVLNRSSAQDWIGRLVPLGGNSQADLVQRGVGGGDLSAGRTNTHSALMHALEVDLEDRREDYDVSADTIFFLSDGEPSAGEFIDTDDILREVRRANELRKVVIHTIALGQYRKDFMRRLAEENGGTFVDLGM